MCAILICRTLPTTLIRPPPLLLQHSRRKAVFLAVLFDGEKLHLTGRTVLDFKFSKAFVLTQPTLSHSLLFFPLLLFFITSCDNRFEGEYWGSVAVESEKVAASKKVEDVINAETLNTAKGTKGGREGWGARERGCGGDLS